MKNHSEIIIKNLLKATLEKKLDPIQDIPWHLVPDKNSPWLPLSICSLYGEPEFDNLSSEQKVLLSQLEFSLLCSISASGEKEVISNIAKIMLKVRYKEFRPYFYHFIQEENNHIHMFMEFCERYGKFFSILYPYVQGEIWDNPETGDLLTFVHVLIFEELGQGLNEFIMNDDSIPELVRSINRYHVQDEGRHISFGRMLVKEHIESTKSLVSSAEWEKLQTHVLKYLSTRHIDYHNVHIYKEVGISSYMNIRNRLIESRNENFFAKNLKYSKRIDSLRKFLLDTQLLPA